jgi:predicted ATP-grasp superfamily ATP-dependent carboligase
LIKIKITATAEEVEVIDVSSYKPRRLPSTTWRDCIKKVWEVDPLECPHCHAEMKIISFISKSQSEVIRKILVAYGGEQINSSSSGPIVEKANSYHSVEPIQVHHWKWWF